MSNGAWMPDPSGRHQLRWWDGQVWTSQVHDDGVTSDDPLVDPVHPVCGVCGTIGVPDDAFCGSCGSALADNVAPTIAPAPNAPPNSATPSPDPALAGTRAVGRQRLLLLGGVGMVIVVIAVAALLLLGGSGDSDSSPVTTGPDAPPPATEPAVTQPPATQPLETQPSTTQPPETQPPTTQPHQTDPPTTEPPVTAPGSSEHFQEVSGRIDETTGGFLALDVRLEVGDALRYRVEPGPDVDPTLLVLVGPSVARATAEEAVERFSPDSRPDDFEDQLDRWRRDTTQDLNPGAARTTFDGLYKLEWTDSGLLGQIDTGFIVGLHPGEYIVLAQAWAGSDEARLMVEVSPGRLPTESDLDIYRNEHWVLLDIDPWFEDRAFFYGTDPYTPGMIGTTGGRDQWHLAEMLLEELYLEGFSPDRSCVFDVTAQLSDEDARAVLEGREHDVSREGEDALFGLFLCGLLMD